MAHNPGEPSSALNRAMTEAVQAAASVVRLRQELWSAELKENSKERFRQILLGIFAWTFFFTTCLLGGLWVTLSLRDWGVPSWNIALVVLAAGFSASLIALWRASK
jgi:hypothetical protein